MLFRYRALPGLEEQLLARGEARCPVLEPGDECGGVDALLVSEGAAHIDYRLVHGLRRGDHARKGAPLI